MDYKKIWYRFCTYVLKSKRESERISQSEFFFRDSLVDYFCIELGWGRDCIKTEYVVPSGSSDKKCDIMFFNDNVEQFLIECKRPDNKQSLRNRKQIDSYIATTRIGVGIYFGEHIEIFYDERTDNSLALPVLRIDYIPENNPNGELFVKLLHKDMFNKESLLQCCKERYMPLSYLTSEFKDSDKYIKSLILQDLQRRYSDCDDQLLQELLSRYLVRLTDKYTVQSKPCKPSKNEDIQEESNIKDDINKLPIPLSASCDNKSLPISADKIQTVKNDVAQTLLKLHGLYDSEEKEVIITPFSDAYLEKRKLFKLQTRIDQKDMVLYAFYKYVFPENVVEIQSVHSKYNSIVSNEKRNTVRVEIPMSLWKRAMELFGAKNTKKQIAAEAVCYFLDQVCK